MKRAVLGFVIAVLLAVALVALGCGSSNLGNNTEKNSTEEGGTTTVSVDEDVSEGILGTFMKGADKIAFMEDGTFVIAGPGGSKKGTYKVEKTSSGTSSVTLNYEEGVTQSWSVMIGDGKVAAVANPDGETWTKQ